MATESSTFNIHGVVGIEIIYAHELEARKLLRSLDPFRGDLPGPPDITVRFFDRDDIQDWRYVGQDKAGFNGADFFVLDESGDRVSAIIPFDDIGDRCEIWYEAGAKTTPLFKEIIRLTFLSRGYVPVHGSAFVFDYRGVLATGWARGGKTRTLLAFAKNGAKYVADDWVLLSSEDRQMFGLPGSVTLWAWQFEHIPELVPRIRPRKRLFLSIIKLFDRAYRMLATSKLGEFVPLESLGKLVAMARRQLKISRSPEAIFGGFDRNPQPLDIALLVISHTAPQIAIRPGNTQMLVRRILSTNSFEWRDLLGYYEAFKFAFPDRANPLLDDLSGRQEALLEMALEGTPTHEVLSPYPVDLDDLFQRLCEPVEQVGVNPRHEERSE